ncbi:hypothetical protein SKAU_G00190410 [Synaphobranchus kaupii]|uniref:Uncharacterized protein n=1 Tax=Synaphobranchus kaupii TaxID=118154 RepID=A0A9Q1FDJ4_SYNKA|nr:hypothetical protein SKAU_G00190410 [Synaphobranchus kaupii]
MLVSSRMAPPLECTHTTLYLHRPIRERSCTGLYAPSGRGRGFICEGRAPPHAPRSGSCEQRGEGPAAQRGGACETAAAVQGGTAADLNWLAIQRHGDRRAGVTVANSGAKVTGQRGRNNGDALSSRCLWRSITWPLRAPTHKFRGPQQGNRWMERTMEGEGTPQRQQRSLDNTEISATQPGSSWTAATSPEPLLLGLEAHFGVPGSRNVCNELGAGRQANSLSDFQTCGSSADLCSELSECDSELCLEDLRDPAGLDLEGCKPRELRGAPPLHASSPAGSPHEEEEPLAQEWEEALPALGEALACSLYGALLMESIGDYGEWEGGHWSPLLEGSSLDSSTPDSPLSPPADDPNLPAGTPTSHTTPIPRAGVGCGRCPSSPSFSGSGGWRNASPFPASLCARPSQRILLLPQRPSEVEEEEEARGEGTASPAEGGDESAASVSDKGSSERPSLTPGESVRNVSSPASGR